MTRRDGTIGRRYSHGRYEVTFVMDAEDCENVASCLPSNDGFASDLFDIADEMRRLEEARDQEPRLQIVLVAR